MIESRNDHELRLDTERLGRTGEPEVVFSEGKSDAQIVAAFCALHDAHGRALATRVDDERSARILESLDGIDARYCEMSRTIRSGAPLPLRGHVAILAAGTSDASVAREVEVAVEFVGTRTTRDVDVGVAGIERLFACRENWQDADAIVVVAGMDGALASVVAGRTDRPVIAVPTSVGYGAAFEGLAALLSMLNACAPGVAVVNIDNGFGAGLLAARIARRSPPTEDGKPQYDGSGA